MANETNPTTPTAEQPVAPAPETPAPHGDATGKQADGAEKHFTQAEVDALIGKYRAQDKEKAKADAEKARADAERKAAEETGQYKALYEKQQTELAAAKAEAHAAKLRGLRRDVAAKVNLPAALAERLQGETEDELEADAKALLAALPKAAAPNINGQGGAQPPANGWDETERKRLASIYGVSAKHFGAQ